MGRRGSREPAISPAAFALVRGWRTSRMKLLEEQEDGY